VPARLYDRLVHVQGVPQRDSALDTASLSRPWSDSGFPKARNTEIVRWI